MPDEAPKTPAEPEIRFSLNLTKSMDSRLTRLATDDKRSRAAQVRQLIDEAYDARYADEGVAA